jgi:hypothetical protein
MRAVLHLLSGSHTALALPVIEQQRREPETRVTVVLLPGADAPVLPDGVTARRVDHDLTHSQLLDLIFESDQVIAW